MIKLEKLVQQWMISLILVIKERAIKSDRDYSTEQVVAQLPVLYLV